MVAHAETGRPGDGTIRCAGRGKVHGWWRPGVTLISNGLLTGWHSTLPSDWFHYNGYESFDNVDKLISSQVFPLVGEKATVFWLYLIDFILMKCQVIHFVCSVTESVNNVNAKSEVFFVTHPPMARDLNLEVINYNKNLLFAIRKVRREAGHKLMVVGLHHWCLRQKRMWENPGRIPEMDLSMLLFLILDEVLKA